ncbi:hypothetical protein A5634_00410 [Mycobacterium asiaticum]|uniref:DUF732 domain-containing protein n=1 Tax=Mycobacterium asiaticum TaxID=1790 RepID=A0A1A3NLC8_MYCAS|nr:DUF732 domain-containing protein [Mycobacterium asiaticum]OBK22948.1 hypothetical protein A5634_00410 [Mycobacterium asiaticum]
MPISQRRSTKSVRYLAGPVLAAALISLTEVATAPAAPADAVDGQFLNAIQSHGINFASPQAAILAGHQVCNELDGGRPKAEVASDVAGSSNLDGYHAGYFVGVSIAAYCPRHHTAS